MLTSPPRLIEPQPVPVAKTANVSAVPYSRSSAPDTSTIAAVDGGTVPSEMICHVWITAVSVRPYGTTDLIDIRMATAP